MEEEEASWSGASERKARCGSWISFKSIKMKLNQQFLDVCVNCLHFYLVFQLIFIHLRCNRLYVLAIGFMKYTHKFPVSMLQEAHRRPTKTSSPPTHPPPLTGIILSFSQITPDHISHFRRYMRDSQRRNLLFWQFIFREHLSEGLWWAWNGLRQKTKMFLEFGNLKKCEKATN